MPPPLPVPYQPQIADGYCLAACAQMILAYWGLPANQEALAGRLGVISGVGVPAGRITRLASAQVTAVYDTGDWETAAGWLDREVPVIVMVQAGELPHWRGSEFSHAVVVVGYDAANVWLLDPAALPAPISVSIDEFILAWGELDFRYAALHPPQTGLSS
jgi:ABC-type bacteriocin/lantibiotic exporter with double-glycine peptidase domain